MHVARTAEDDAFRPGISGSNLPSFVHHHHADRHIIYKYYKSIYIATWMRYVALGPRPWRSRIYTNLYYIELARW